MRMATHPTSMATGRRWQESQALDWLMQEDPADPAEGPPEGFDRTSLLGRRSRTQLVCPVCTRGESGRNWWVHCEIFAEGWGGSRSTAKLRWGSPDSNILVKMRPERGLTTGYSKQFDVDGAAEEDQA